MIAVGILAQQGSSAEPPSASTFRAVQKSTNPSPYGFYEFLPAGYNNMASAPLLIFLHGSDERGDGNSQLNRVLTWGPPKMGDAATFDENLIMLAPQWLGNDDNGYYAYEDLADFIQYAKDTYKVDEDRIYLNGLSAGNWLGMYYLGNLPTSHGIAAMAVTSGTLDLDGGYTPASFVAPSECPMWWISNINDPSVPWDGTKPPVAQYVPVVTAVSQINAITSGMVEKLTGFNNNTHTGTWDGIYDGSLVGSGNPSFDLYDETVYDWLLSHSSGGAPAQRTFNVGTGSGNLTVNGTNTSADWYPIQDNDKFVIKSGTYSYIRFQNMLLASGNVNVVCDGPVTLTAEGLLLSQANKNLTLNFYNQVVGLEYGLIIDNDTHPVTLDEQGVGGYENIKIRGVSIIGMGPGSRILNHNAPLYDNGSGPIASTNVVVEDWRIEVDDSLYIDSLCIGGQPWTNNEYTTRNINPVIRRVDFVGNYEVQYPALLINCEGGLISEVSFDGLNSQVTANLHCRLSNIRGQGTIEKIRAKNHMGNAACIWGFYRTGNNPLSIIRNIIASNSNRYSAVEIQGFSNYNQPGIGASTNYKILGVTADTLDTEIYFSGCAADIYNTFGGSVTVRNAVSINGHSNDSGGNDPIRNMLGSITEQGTAVYANTTAAGVDSGYVPQPGSALIGVGSSDADLDDDFYGNDRSNPPAIGAVEPQ